MATPFSVDSSKHQREVWAWLEPEFSQHRRQLYLFALGVLGNREDAEDATQIVLLNAYRALVRGERPTWPRAWLFAIALNVCRRLRRQASARHALVATTRELLSVPRGSDAPTGAEISQALSSLPPGQRKIFLLRELRGLSYAELSERLGLSLAATESLLARARRRLREELVASDEGPDLRSRRRRPLIGIPGAGAALRLAQAPSTFKLAGLARLAGLAGTAAIAPVLVGGLHAAPERSHPLWLEARAAPLSQPADQAAFALPAKRLSSSPTSMARPTRGRSPGALPIGVPSLGPARADPTTGAAATDAANPEPRAAEVLSRHSAPASDTSVHVTGRLPAEPSATTSPVPIADATADEAVEDTLATVSGAVVDVVTAAVPTTVVPPDVTPDAQPEEVVPDPPPVVEDVLDVASSAVSDATSAASDGTSAVSAVSDATSAVSAALP